MSHVEADGPKLDDRNPFQQAERDLTDRYYDSQRVWPRAWNPIQIDVTALIIPPILLLQPSLVPGGVPCCAVRLFQYPGSPRRSPGLGFPDQRLYEDAW